MRATRTMTSARPRQGPPGPYLVTTRTQVRPSIGVFERTQFAGHKTPSTDPASALSRPSNAFGSARPGPYISRTRAAPLSCHGRARASRGFPHSQRDLPKRTLHDLTSWYAWHDLVEGHASCPTSSCKALPGLPDVSGMYRGCIGDVSGMYRGCIGDVSGTYRGRIGDVSGMYRGCIGDATGMHRG